MLTPALTLSYSSSGPAVVPFSRSAALRTLTSPLNISTPLPTSTRPEFRIQVSASSSSQSPMIEKEIDASSSSSNSVRARFEKMIRDAQDSVCSAIEAADGGGKFQEDVWSRPGGGGGISRVLQDAAVWEKAGVNVAVVYGVMPPDAYRAAKPSQNGISSVICGAHCIETINMMSGVLQAAPAVLTSLLNHHSLPRPSPIWSYKIGIGRSAAFLVKTNRQDSTSTSTPAAQQQQQSDDLDPQDLQYVSQIKTVLELLKKNRDMLFNEVKLTVLIEDPRDVERKRLLGIDDETAPTRDDLADALVQVNEGKVPENRLALQMLAEEMLQWPNLEVEVQKKKKPGKSLYAKFTDTGINPLEAAKRLNIDWDSAAEIGGAETDDVEVPPAVGYGALYLITAFPVIIGISVVLILFYNSLQ